MNYYCDDDVPAYHQLKNFNLSHSFKQRSLGHALMHFGERIRWYFARRRSYVHKKSTRTSQAQTTQRLHGFKVKPKRSRRLRTAPKNCNRKCKIEVMNSWSNSCVTTTSFFFSFIFRIQIWLIWKPVFPWAEPNQQRLKYSTIQERIQTNDWSDASLDQTLRKFDYAIISFSSWNHV